MYAQASQNFPGIVVDLQKQRLNFDTSRFEQELGDYSEKMVHAETFALSQEYSAVYHKFLARNLRGYHAIRGKSPDQ